MRPTLSHLHLTLHDELSRTSRIQSRCAVNLTGTRRLQSRGTIMSRRSHVAMRPWSWSAFARATGASTSARRNRFWALLKMCWHWWCAARRLSRRNQAHRDEMIVFIRTSGEGERARLSFRWTNYRAVIGGGLTIGYHHSSLSANASISKSTLQITFVTRLPNFALTK